MLWLKIIISICIPFPPNSLQKKKEKDFKKNYYFSFVLRLLNKNKCDDLIAWWYLVVFFLVLIVSRPSRKYIQSPMLFIFHCSCFWAATAEAAPRKTQHYDKFFLFTDVVNYLMVRERIMSVRPWNRVSTATSRSKVYLVEGKRAEAEAPSPPPPSTILQPS